MPELILSPRFSPDSNALWRAALNAGWDVTRLDSYMIERYEADKIAIYGEQFFIQVIADNLHLALLQPTPDWLTTLPERYLRRSVRQTTLGAVRGETYPLFVKPGDGSKTFDAQVYDRADDLPDAQAWPDDTLVLVSNPVAWDVEFRCVVLERNVITFSPYKRQGLALAQDWQASPDETDAALRFASSVLADTAVDAPPAFVLDVGQIRGAGWAVIEANPIMAAGIYGCDPTQVMVALRRACVPRNRLTAEDARWAMS